MSKDDQKFNFSYDGDWIMTALAIFLFFWIMGGWHRIDCALNIERACELIKAENQYKLPDVKK